MSKRIRIAWGLAAGLGLLLSLSACGGGGGYGGGGGGSAAAMTMTTGYVPDDLVANSSAITAQFIYTNLVNPWGIAFNPEGFGWVANQATSTSSLYDGNGVAQTAYAGGPVAITIAKGSSGLGLPTGIVYNSSLTSGSNAFVLSDGAAATFLYATLGGAIEGWNTGTASFAVIAYDGGASGAAYTGLAIGADSGGNYFLYAANFKQGSVDVFDHGFNKVTPAGAFADAAIPAGYAAFGIQNVLSSSGATQIYVTYAEPNAAKNASVAGAGLGYVAVFDVDGNLTKTLISGGVLNAPWGVAMAPASGFGAFSGMLLIGNFGDGTINAFNASTGAAAGTLMQNSTQLQIPGLWGIAFGNGINNQPATTLFFAAGPNSETAGVYGRIDVAGSANAPTSPMSPY